MRVTSSSIAARSPSSWARARSRASEAPQVTKLRGVGCVGVESFIVLQAFRFGSGLQEEPPLVRSARAIAASETAGLRRPFAAPASGGFGLTRFSAGGERRPSGVDRVLGEDVLDERVLEGLLAGRDDCAGRQLALDLLDLVLDVQCHAGHQRGE